jgi:hypothetical protein
VDIGVEDRLAIRELVELHGHVCDDGQLERLDEIFATDVAYDLGSYGYGVLVGVDAVRGAALALGEANPLGHHVTNVVVTDVMRGGSAGTADEVLVSSKGLAVQADGTTGSVVYRDVLRRTAEGWRITRRTVVPRRTPLQP